MLSTLNHEHRFFAKDYTPSREELGNRGKPRKEPEPPLRADLFYKNLPQHLGRKIPRFIRLAEDEQSAEEEEDDDDSVQDVFGEVHDQHQQPVHTQLLGRGAGKMKSGAQSHRGNEEQKASEREQQQNLQDQEKLQMKPANIKKKQAPPQQLFQGGYSNHRPQQQSQSPVRYDKISAANTKQGFARKDPAEKGHQQEHGGRNNPKRPAYDRFEDSGFLVPYNHGHHSVFQEVQGTDARGSDHRGGCGRISSQHVTPMKPGGLYQDPTMNQSQS